MYKAGKMRENRLSWFGRAERKNNADTAKKLGEIRVENNRGNGR